MPPLNVLPLRVLRSSVPRDGCFQVCTRRPGIIRKAGCLVSVYFFLAAGAAGLSVDAGAGLAAVVPAAGFESMLVAIIRYWTVTLSPTFGAPFVDASVLNSHVSDGLFCTVNVPASTVQK